MIRRIVDYIHTHRPAQLSFLSETGNLDNFWKMDKAGVMEKSTPHHLMMPRRLAL